MHPLLLFGTNDAHKRQFLKEFIQKTKPRLTHYFGEVRALGIDDAHEIRRRASIAPGDGVQAFIIERADEMTAEAAQAFLKLLEEPPAGSLFVLLASSSEMPQTILSRVTKFPFFEESDAENTSAVFEVMARLKGKLEADIRKKKTVPRGLMMRLLQTVKLANLLHTSRVSLRSIEEYTRATLE